MENIKYDWIPCRIDVFLTKYFDMSRNFFHHLFQKQAISVNNKFIKKSYVLKNNDIIEIVDLNRFTWPLLLDESPNIELKVLLEKDDYLIIYKPKWVLSHPSSIWDVKVPSVVGFLYFRYKTLPSIWNFIRAWLIHRLDKNTDWLMIVVKTEQWLSHFKNLFKQKSESQTIEQKELVPLKKFYQATVNITDIWSNFLDSINWKYPYYINEIVQTKNTFNKNYKIWITKILNVELLDWNKALLNIEILTGRTHQIRYHLSKYWLPIVWDELYWLWENIPMWLTAYKLEFLDNEWEHISMTINDRY